MSGSSLNKPIKSFVTAFAPATVANVGCGFDVLGFAVNEPGDEVSVKVGTGSGVTIVEINGDQGRLPKETSKNTAGVAILEFLKRISASVALEVRIKKKMPLGSGLGSSAASAVAGAVAVNELFGNPLSREDLLPFVMEGEKIACGASHADNVAPSLLGGFVLIRSYDPLDTIRISSPKGLTAIVVHPHLEVRTEDARRILRKDIPLKKAIVQWGNIAGLVAGLLKGDFDLIGRSLHDAIIEPERAVLIPGFDAVKGAALKSGALGCSISGSGPSIFALTKEASLAAEVGTSMSREFSNLGVDSDVFISPVNENGATILEAK